MNRARDLIVPLPQARGQRPEVALITVHLASYEIFTSRPIRRSLWPFGIPLGRGMEGARASPCVLTQARCQRQREERCFEPHEILCTARNNNKFDSCIFRKILPNNKLFTVLPSLARGSLAPKRQEILFHYLHFQLMKSACIPFSQSPIFNRFRYPLAHRALNFICRTSLHVLSVAPCFWFYDGLQKKNILRSSLKKNLH